MRKYNPSFISTDNKTNKQNKNIDIDIWYFYHII